MKRGIHRSVVLMPEDDLEEDNESSVEVISGSEISEDDDSDHIDSDHNDNTNVHGMTYNSSRNAE